MTGAASYTGILLGDRNGFTQQVVNENGQVVTARSGTGVSILGLSAGLRTPDFPIWVNPINVAWVAAHAYCRAGYAWADAGRGIASCLGCSSENIDVIGGPFVEPGALIGLKADDGIGAFAFVAYRNYFGGSSVSGEAQLGVGISYF